MRIIVCGGRKWSDRTLMNNVLLKIKKKQDKYKGIVTIIHGCCAGADEMAGDIARSIARSSCWEEERFLANWKLYGKAAGPMRNQKMIDKGKPDLILAFHNNIRQSKGTLDMVLRGLENGIKVKLYPRRKIK